MLFRSPERKVQRPGVQIGVGEKAVRKRTPPLTMAIVCGSASPYGEKSSWSSSNNTTILGLSGSAARSRRGDFDGAAPADGFDGTPGRDRVAAGRLGRKAVRFSTRAGGGSDPGCDGFEPRFERAGVVRTAGRGTLGP